MSKKKEKPDFLVNCIAVECPDLVKDWDETKNTPMTVFNTSYRSTKKVWWKCHKCNHEWQAFLHNRSVGETGCPNCAGRVINLENSFANSNPSLLEEWHPSKNLPNTPYNIFPSSKEKFHWICKLCEKEWEATAASRNVTNGQGGCPTCAKLKNHHNLSPLKEFQKLNREIIIKSKFIKADR